MEALVIPHQNLALGNKLPSEMVEKLEEQTRQPKQALKPDEFLTKILNAADKECEQDCIPRAEVWNRNYNFFRGGLANLQGYNVRGIWKHLNDLSGLYSSNNYAEKIMTLGSVLVRSNPKFKVTPTPGADDYQKQSGAVIGQRLTEHDIREKCPASFRLREWFFRLIFGNSFRYINFDKDAGCEAKSPKTEQQEFGSQGMNYCPKCGMTFPGEQRPCQCGEQNVEHFEGESFSDDVLSGEYESVKTGDTRLWTPSPWEIGLPPNARLHVDNGEIAWDFVAWYQKTRKKRVGYAFNIGEKFTDELRMPFMLQAQERLERRWTGEGIVQAKDFCVLRRYWLRPYMYYGEKCGQDITLADGTEIARGSRYIDYLKDGMYVARVGNAPLDIQAICLDDSWSQSHYTYDPMSPWGKGTEDGADLQVILNALYQVVVEHGRRDSVGITIANKDVGINVSDFQGGNVIPVSGGQGVDFDVRKAATMLSGNALNPTIFNTLDGARKDQTAVTGASSVLSGTNETIPDTLGATQLLVQRATTILTPMFMMDVEQGIRCWTQNLKLRQKYQSAEVFVPFSDDNEPEQGRFFDASSISQDFVVSSVEGSWMPQDSLDVRAELEQAFALGGEVLPGGLFNPEFPVEAKQVALSALTTLPRSMNKSAGDESVAHSRLKAIKQGLEHVKKMQVPEEYMQEAIEQILTMPSVKFRPDIDDPTVHLNIAKVYATSILNDPEDVDYLLVQAVEGYIQMVKEGGVEQGKEKTATDLLIQEPAIQAEQALAAQQAANMPPPEQEQPAPPDENAMMAQEHEGQMHVAQAQEADKGRQHELTVKEKDAQEAEKQRQHERKMAKARPKGNK